VATVLVDTGFLVALYIRGDTLHCPAREYLRNNRSALLTVAPVVVEACFFLDAAGKSAMLNWIVDGGLAVANLPVSSYREIAGFISKYADQEVDFADAALVWLANQGTTYRILTVDETDFRLYRVKDGGVFDLVQWYDRR
jgi:predicted nucleic acid-binding protein